MSLVIKEINGVQLFAVEDLSPHYEIEEFIGVTVGNTVFGGNVFRDIFAGFRDFFGGRTRGYERLVS